MDLAEKVRGEDSVVFGTKPGDPKINERLDADGLPFIGSTLKYGDPFYSYINLNTGQSFVNFYKYVLHHIINIEKTIQHTSVYFFASELLK